VIHHPVLDQAASAGIKLGLERVRSFLAFLGEPHRAYPTIHIGGTNGKGSVSSMVTAALVDAGYRVGTNISPHLEDVNERIQLDGVPVDDASFVEALEHLDRARWEWARGLQDAGIPLTYFELLTVLAMHIFAQRGVDVAVFEVGLGGRLDATNVIQPVATAVTSIGLDHTDVLGDTLALIAAEKAGILKRGASVVLGALPPEAREVLELRARALDLTLWRPGRELMREQRGGRWSLRGPDGGLNDVKLTLRGDHQGGNALVALGLLQSLRRQGFHIPDGAIRSGLERATIAGRIETLAPGVIADGCHNPQGAEAFARWLADQPRPASRILLFGMSHDRDPRPVIGPLLSLVDEVVLTRCAHPKASEPSALGALLEDVDAVLSDGGPIEEALPEVLTDADEVIVAGSLYLVGAARSLLRSGAVQRPRSS